MSKLELLISLQAHYERMLQIKVRDPRALDYDAVKYLERLTTRIDELTEALITEPKDGKTVTEENSNG